MLFNMPLSCISAKTFYLRKTARSSHRRCSTKKVLCVLTNLQNSQENTCARAWHSCFLQEYLFPEDFWATVSGQYVFFVHECSCKDTYISVPAQYFLLEPNPFEKQSINQVFLIFCK